MKKNIKKFISRVGTIKNSIFNVHQKIGIKGLEFVGNKYIYKDQAASDLITKVLNRNEPCLIARFGTTELSVINFFLQNKKLGCKFPEDLKKNISELSGFFPNSDNSLIRFCCESLACIDNIDVLGLRSKPYEEQFYELEIKFVNMLNSKSYLTDIEDLTPFFAEKPWTACLENKKVLVIHPFKDSIITQYNKRSLLFKDDKILPRFELKTIKAVQSLADSKNKLPFNTWFEALEHMYEEIDEIDFDIAIIGAGAYGLFLADYCKKKGKKAIVIGGGLQVLFGIKGKRWDEIPEWNNRMYNENWIYPLDSEKPTNYKKVEGGCYW